MKTFHHRAVASRNAPPNTPKVCARCGHPMVLLPGAPRWTHA